MGLSADIARTGAHLRNKTDTASLSLRNKILLAIPETEVRLLHPLLQPFTFRQHTILHEPTQELEFAYFPNRGLISLLVATMDGIEDGTLKAVPQPNEGITLAPKINVEDAQVDWAAPALRVDRVVRGCTPAPGAWTVFRGERLKLIQAVPVPERTDLAPGALAVGKNNVYVGTGSYAVELLWVQAQGKKPMRAADWARGARIGAGESVGALGAA